MGWALPLPGSFPDNVETRLRQLNDAHWYLTSWYQLPNASFVVNMIYRNPHPTSRHYSTQFGTGTTLGASLDAVAINIVAAESMLSYRDTVRLTEAIDLLTNALRM